MSYLNNIAAAIEAVLQQLPTLKERADDQWEELERELLAVLLDLAETTDETQAKERLTDLLVLGMGTSAASIFRRIMQAYPLDGGLVEASRLGDRFTTRGHQPPGSKDISATVTLDTFRSGIAETLAQLQGASPLESTPLDTGISSIARYLNAGFFSEAGEYVEPAQPLALSERYQLVVNIGAPWGPGNPGEAWPDDKLQQAFAEYGTLDLDVVVTGSADLDLAVTQQTLRLTATESEFCTFSLQLRRAGRKFIDVDVLFAGHLLQTRRTEFQVVSPTSPPDENLPMQHGYISWTRTAVLTPESLQTLAEKPRRLTIALGRHEDEIGLRFYDNSGQALAFQAYDLSESGLQNLMTEVRDQLLHMMGSYRAAVGGTPQTLLASLGPLAELGNAFFHNLFPPDEDFSPTIYQSLQLAAGEIIQVAPLSKQLSVPWEAIYDRPIESYDRARIRLCDTYRQHGPEASDCPHQGDVTILCPHGFWGFRYIIEQLPCRVDANEPPVAPDVSAYVRNDIPLRMNAILHISLSELAGHLQRLRALSPDLNLLEIRDKESAKRAFQDQTLPPDMIYFYTHGGLDRSQSYAGVGEKEQIKEGDLHAWKPNFWRKRPLIFINACESAAYTPDSFENMLQFFARHGASGVIATQCPVLELLADAVSVRFFCAFWQQIPAGQALYQARRDLLFAERADPRGLAYSLFASADVQLAQPIIQA